MHPKLQNLCDVHLSFLLLSPDEESFPVQFLWRKMPVSAHIPGLHAVWSILPPASVETVQINVHCLPVPALHLLKTPAVHYIRSGSSYVHWHRSCDAMPFPEVPDSENDILSFFPVPLILSYFLPILFFTYHLR